MSTRRFAFLIATLSALLAACAASPVDKILAALNPPPGEPPAYELASVSTLPGYWSARVLVQDPQLTEDQARQVAAAVIREQLASGRIAALQFTVLGMGTQMGLQVPFKVYRVRVALSRTGANQMLWFEASSFPAIEFSTD